MKNTSAWALALSCALLLAAPTVLKAAPAESEMAPTDKQLNSLYWQGQEELKHSDWPAALKRFQDLEQQLRSKEPRNVDTALYWQAYTLVQSKRTAEARSTTERLHREFPDSRWGKEADALLRQAQPPVAATELSIGGDEELAAIAVEGLMNAPPERAFPLLKKVLQSKHSTEVKKKALFVLSQYGTPEALQVVVDVARTDSDPQLREEAINMLGVSGDQAAIERLRELYASSKDREEKRHVMQAWLVAERKDLVLNAARNEPDAELRAEAVQILGAMDAKVELKQLFDASKDFATQSAVIQSLGVAGDAPTLAAIAGGSQSEQVRIEAIHGLGLCGDEAGSAALVKLYAAANTPGLRDAVLQGLMVAGNSKALLQLYRSAKDKDEKQNLLRTITAMDSDVALEAIEQELNK